jgi:Ulp1 protease family, C-terminal catalytic domain
MKQRQCDTAGEAKFKQDEMVVNYHDACIFGRDLDLLQSPTAWLNDSCIHFYMTFLQQQDIQQQQQPTTTTTTMARCGRTLYMDPCVISFLMHQCDDDDDLMEFGRGACQNFSPDIYRLVIPINDQMAASRSTWATPNAGMHWSLLVILLFHPTARTLSTSDNDRLEGDISNDENADAGVYCCLHMDSVKNSVNLNAARTVASKILDARKVVLMMTGTRTTTTGSTTTTTRHGPVQVQECQNIPRQENGHDCGVHVLAAAEAIAKIKPKDDVGGDESRVLLQQQYEMAIQNHFGAGMMVQGNNNLSHYCETVRRRVVDTILTVRRSNT